MVVQPIGTEKTHGAWCRGKRVVALDGTTLDVADSEENVAFFGRPGSSRGEQSGFPRPGWSRWWSVGPTSTSMMRLEH